MKLQDLDKIKRACLLELDELIQVSRKSAAGKCIRKNIEELAERKAYTTIF